MISFKHFALAVIARLLSGAFDTITRLMSSSCLFIILKFFLLKLNVLFVNFLDTLVSVLITIVQWIRQMNQTSQHQRMI